MKHSLFATGVSTVLLLTMQPADKLLAAELGRLFTTPEQRITLEKERHKQPVVEIKPEIVLKPEPVVEEKTSPEVGSITLNGLVYRSNGKSTAWVNNANTFEGNLGNQYLQIDARNIDPDKVVIEIPVAETSVNLKAGETYNPVPETIEIPDNQIKP